MAIIKTVALTLLLGAAAAILTFGPRPDAKYPPGFTVLQYWEKWTGREADQMQEIVDDFNNSVGKEKKIYVQYLSISGVDQKTLTATAAGVPPDIAGVWDDNLAAWAAADALEPLDDMARDHGITEGYYKPVFWKGCQYRGKLFGLISTPASVALQWNKKGFIDHAKALQDQGCDPTRAPRTLEELNRYSKALDQSDDRGHLLRIGSTPLIPGWYVYQTVYWFGGDIFDEKTQKFMLTTPQSIAALKWVKSYADRLGPRAMSDFKSGLSQSNSDHDPFVEDLVMMQQYGPWAANFFEEVRPRLNHWKIQDKAMEAGMTVEERRDNCSWAIAPFPSVYSDHLTGDDLIDQGATACRFDVLVIPATAHHKKEAFDFIAFVNTRKESEKICAYHCSPSPLMHDSPDWARKHPNPYIDIFDRLSLSPHAHAVPPVPIWPEVVTELTNLYQHISSPDLRDTPDETPEANLQRVQDLLQSKLEQYYQRHPTARPEVQQ